MRYSLLAGGKRIRPVLALATAKALGRDAARRAPARRRARAHPHLLADPRRPAGDGRRRPAAGAADVPRQVRRGRRDPGRRRALRGGVPARAARAARRAGARCWRRSPSWPPPPASTAWSAASTSTCRSLVAGGRREPAAAARAQDRAADRRVRGVRTAAERRGAATTLTHFRSFAAELGLLFQIVDDILDVTGTEDALGKPQGSDERHGKLTYVSQYGLEGAREMALESHRNARDALRRAAPDGARGARADHRLHLHPDLMTRSSTASTARRTCTASPRTSCSRSRRRSASS